MGKLRVGNDEFESGCDVIDVTSLSRPDTDWRFTDASGHLHQWFVKGQPATGYRPLDSYDVPTVVRIVDIPASEEYPAETHLECRECGEHIHPGFKADEYRTYIPGLRWCRINDVDVSQEEFERRLKEATKQGH